MKALSEFFANQLLSPPQQTARSYIFDCPQCGGHRKLYIQKSNGLANCMKQGSQDCPKPSSSGPVYALSLLTSQTIQEVNQQLFSYRRSEGDEIKVDLSEEDDIFKEEIPEPMDKSMWPHDMTMIGIPGFEPGQKYLNGRGITDDQMLKYEIGYSPSQKRVIFPVIVNGEPYGWQGRQIENVDKRFRMKNLPGNWKNYTLMFHDNIIGQKQIIVAEGAVSALKFEKAGAFVATMGKSVGTHQLELMLKQKPEKIYLALDRDAQAEISSLRTRIVKMQLEPVQIFSVPVPKHRDDFGDCTQEECVQAIQEQEEMTGSEINVFIEAGKWE